MGVEVAEGEQWDERRLEGKACRNLLREAAVEEGEGDLVALERAGRGGRNRSRVCDGQTQSQIAFSPSSKHLFGRHSVKRRDCHLA